MKREEINDVKAIIDLFLKECPDSKEEWNKISFLNHFITQYSNLKIISEKTSIKKKYIFKLFQKILKEKNNRNIRYKKIDILYISRDRFMKIPTNKALKSDYLFWSIIEKINEKYPRIKMVLWSSDFSPPQKINIITFGRYSYFTFKMLIEVMINAYKLNLKWNRKKTRIFRYMDLHGLKKYRNILNSFYSRKYQFSSRINNLLIKRIISKFNPRLVLANDDVLFLKDWSKKDIKLIVFQSAQVLKELEDLRRIFITKMDLDQYKSDFYLASGDQSGNLKKYSLTSKKVISIGQPRFDYLINIDPLINKKNIFHELKLKENNFIILWATQTHRLSDEENEKSINSMNELLSRISNLQLIIKLHPAEGQEGIIYQNGLPKEKVAICDNSYNTSELLSISNVLLIKHSAVAMEAIIMNKPVGVLHFDDESYLNEYTEKGVATGISNMDDLISFVNNVRKGNKVLFKSRQDFIINYLYRTDGMATKRAMKLIMKIIYRNR